MKKLALYFCFLFCGITVFSQGIYTPFNPTTYGLKQQRILPTLVLHTPEKDTTTNTTDTTAQIFYRPADSSWWGWSLSKGFQKIGVGGGGTDNASYHTLTNAPDSSYTIFHRPDGTQDTSFQKTTNIRTQYPNYAPNDSTIGTRTDSMPKVTYGTGVDTSALTGLDLVPAKWVTDRIGTTSFDTTKIPNFSVKVRSLFSATSPIVYSNGNYSLDTNIVHSSVYNDGRYLQNITGLVTQGTNVTITGSGTSGSPYVVNSSGTGSGITKAYAPLIVTSGGDSIYTRYNVKAYGALGNGVHDDTKNIQAAINAAYAAGGGQVFFPNGKYLIHDTLITASTFSGGIRFGGSNSQLYIPDNQTPFSGHQLVNISFIGESVPNMFFSTLTSYPINTSGVILYSDISGSGTNPVILGSAGDSWAFGTINDAQVSMKNINMRVKANIGASGPTMSAIDFHRISNIGHFENVMCDIDTSSNLSVSPVAETFGIWFPTANNSAFNPIQNCVVQGYRNGYIFSEHTVGKNLVAAACRTGYLFTGAPHAEEYDRLGSYWNRYSISNGSTFTANTSAYVSIRQLDVETDTATSHWWKSTYIVYDSTNHLQGDITYHIIQSGSGANADATFNKLGGANSLLQLRALGSYPDTTTRFTGFATLGKAYNDSLTLRGAIPAQFNPIAGANMSITGSYPNITFAATSGGGGSIFSKYGTDSLKAYAPFIYRIGVGADTAYSRFSIANPNVGTGVSDTLGLMLIDTTSATVGVQKYSPVLALRGNGWKTSATAGSQYVEFQFQTQPVQGSTAPTGNLLLTSNVSGSVTTVATFNSGGGVTFPSAVLINGTSTQNGITNTGTVSSSGQITTSRNGAGNTIADGLVSSNATASTSGAPQQFSCAVRLSGTAWDGSASKTADWYILTEPGNGTNPITSKLVFTSVINAGTKNDKFKISDVGRVELFNVLNLQTYTVATLPSGNTGDVARVSDATAPTYLGVLTGGGSVVTPVFYNGSAWVSF